MSTKYKGLITSITEFSHALAWCLKISWKTSKFYTVSRISTEAISPLLAIVAAIIGRSVINSLAGQSDYENIPAVLTVLLATLFVVAVIRSFSQKLVQYCRVMHDDMMDAKITTMIMGHALDADLEYFDNPFYHDKLNSASRDSLAINGIVWNSIGVISSAISMIVALAVLSQISALYGLFMMLAAIPSTIMAAKYTKQLYILSLEQVNGRRQMAYLKNITTDRMFAQDLRLFNSGQKIKSRYMDIWQRLFGTRRDKNRKRTLCVGALECLPEITAALIGIDIAFRVLEGSAAVGDYSLYVVLISQLMNAIFMLSISAMYIYDNRMQLDNFKAIENFKNQVEDKGEGTLESVDTIEFKNVSFFYPGSKSKALDDVSFSLHKDEKIAFVGINGSGKSTLIKMLLRLYNPDEGVILINGKDIASYSLVSLRKNFSVYFQDMSNMSFTLRENFDLSDDRRDDGGRKVRMSEIDHIERAIKKDAEAALDAANCGDIMDKCPMGLDTNITRLFSDEGIELSGGQHQKLALAKALFRRHSALIMDEPSSNLDPRAEHEVFSALKKFTEGKMTIFTSHRLSNVFMAEKIIVMENGKVLEAGTERELLANGCRYAELYKYQADKFTLKK